MDEPTNDMSEEKCWQNSIHEHLKIQTQKYAT
jgi:hypothetical protein